MTAKMPTREQLDQVQLNATTMLWWQGCCALSGATAEVLIAMIPLAEPGAYQPTVWARPDGISTDELSRLLREMADQIDAGRFQSGGVAPTPDSGTPGPKREAGQQTRCCPLCGDEHEPYEPCGDF